MEHQPVLTGLRQVLVYHSTAADGRIDETALVAIILRFAEADLLVETNPDDDEAVMRVERSPTLQHWQLDEVAQRDITSSPHWSTLIGADAPWRWQLTNQQGYRDGVQIELTRGTETTARQWIAAASYLHQAAVAS